MNNLLFIIVSKKLIISTNLADEFVDSDHYLDNTFCVHLAFNMFSFLLKHLQSYNIAIYCYYYYYYYYYYIIQMLLLFKLYYYYILLL